MRDSLTRFSTICLLLLAGICTPLAPAGAEPPTNTDTEAGSLGEVTDPADAFIKAAPSAQATPRAAAPEAVPADESDPYVVSPEEAARLKSIREEKGFLPAEGAAKTEQREAEPSQPAEPEFVDRTAPKTLNESIQGFVDSRYGKDNCTTPRWCDDLVELRCLKKGDGPIYYYNNSTGNMLMTCGRACINPDPYDKRDCKACPYPAWVACREKAWKEKQAYLRRQELAEIKRIEAEEKARQEKVDAILKEIQAIEQECDARIHELEQQLNNIE